MSIALKYSDSLKKSNSVSHIPSYSVLLLNARMKTIDEVRRANLLLAIAREGTAAKLAEKAGTAAAYLSQIKNRTPDSKSGTPKTMGDDIARRIEAALGEAEGWMDTPHSPVVLLPDPLPQPQQDLQKQGEERRMTNREQPFVRSLVTAFDAADGIPDDVVLVPESRITFAAGDGHINYELIEDEEPATYRRSWFQKYGINPDRVKRFRVAGDSMEPMLFARDTILVNLDETQVIDGRLYALRYDHQLRVKYVSKRLDGSLILRSVNPAYKDEEVSAELANQHIEIIGRVRDRSGTGGL